MTPLRLQKGRHSLFADRNRDEAFIRICDTALFFNADEAALIGAWFTKLSVELKREKAYALARIIPHSEE